LEIWQGSQTLSATQKESCAQNKQITAVEYISDTEETVNTFCSNFYHDGAAAFKLSEKLHLLPALSAKDLPAGQTQVLTVRQIKRIDRHYAKCDNDCLSELISDTKI
jgi:hypothetical protein